MSEVRDDVSRRPLQAAVVVEYASARETELARWVDAAVAGGKYDIVVDLGAAEMVGFVALDALHRAGRELGAGGRRLTVVCRHTPLARLLRLALLDQTFAVAGVTEEPA